MASRGGARPSRRRAGALLLGALLSAALTAPPAGAQKLPVRVSGVVMDSTLSRPLPGVVLVLDTGERVRADDRGRFAFETVPPGRHQLMILGAGCRASIAEFDAGTDAREGRRIVVSAAFGAPEPSGEVAPPRNSPGRVVTADEIADMAASSLVDVLRRVAPAMVSRPEGQVGAGARLRGRGARTLADERTPMVVVDGVALYSDDPTLLDRIAPGDVAWLEILPGAIGGWTFGTGGTGGVIRIQTRRGTGLASDADPGDCLMASAADLRDRASPGQTPGP